MAIMLCFFVLMFAMSIPSDTKLVSANVSDGDAPYNANKSEDLGYAGANTAKNISLTDIAAGEDLEYVMTLVQGMVSGMPEETRSQVSVMREENYLRFVAPSILSFSESNVRLADNAQPLIRRLSLLLSGLQNEVVMIGHISKDEERELNKYDQIRLGLERGNVVAELFNAFGYGRDVSIKAYGRHMDDFDSALSEQQAAQISSLSQRVDVLIMGQSGK
jgi:flagellar motor protein MotB